jgi:dihydrofolate synthase/folylpolyglutamate synthase
MDVEVAYNKALDYLYSFVDYSLKHASELAKADFNLDRMYDLMAMLGDPQKSYPIIHVAGTKGKGSVCALCASALHAAGYRVGLFTSPHLQDFCERIQLDGAPIPRADLADLVEAIKPHVARIPFITTFELTTALGFLYFARQKVDFAVIEVGLGGRLDATNIITPLISVITSLSYDHMIVLGTTLAQIAGEKAGIIKPGRPLVSAPQPDEALQAIIKVADERAAPLTLVNRDVLFAPGRHSLDKQTLQVWRRDKPHLDLTIPLLGVHQIENAAVAAASLWTLRNEGIAIPDEAIQKGFAQVQWPGRFEILRSDPPVVIDSAHNRDSALRLRQTLDDYFPTWPVILIFCALEDKDIPGMMAELAPRLERVIATQADHPRAPEAAWIAEQVKQAGVQVETVTPAANALERALELAGDDRALVLTAGSVAFAGEVRTAWQNRICCNEPE